MTEREIQEILDELNTVRPEKLNENAKRLFEAIMKIADERDDLQQRVDKGIEFLKQNAIIDEDIEQFCDDLRYDDCKKLLDILKGNDNPSFEEMVNFLENTYKDLKNQPTLHEELEEERKRIAKIVDDFKGSDNNG